MQRFSYMRTHYRMSFLWIWKCWTIHRTVIQNIYRLFLFSNACQILRYYDFEIDNETINSTAKTADVSYHFTSLDGVARNQEYINKSILFWQWSLEWFRIYRSQKSKKAFDVTDTETCELRLIQMVFDYVLPISVIDLKI